MKVPDGYKRCKCRDADGRELGAQCPKLKRRDRSWNPNHGTWYGKTNIIVPPGEKRADLRAGGFGTQEDMRNWFTAAIALLSIPEGGPAGHRARMEILALIHATRKDGSALPALEDIKRRHATGAAFAPGETGAYLLAWLEEHEQADHWTVTTARSYRSRVENLFLPAFGKIPLDKLSTKHILDMFTEIDRKSLLITEARKSPDPEVRAAAAGKRPATAATKRRILAVLSSALGDACSPEKRLLTVNVAAGVSFGRRQKGRKSSRVQPKLWTAEREAAWRKDFEWRCLDLGPRERFEAWRYAPAKPGAVMVWRPEQIGEFLDAAAGHRMYPVFCVACYLAFRRSEACGLKWTETDLDAGKLLVGESTLVQLGREVIAQDEAKTEESKAWVAVQPEVSGPLKACRKQQAAERLAWGPEWQDTGYCFTWQNGQPYDPEQVSGAWERIAFDAGLPPVTLRDARHFAPTLALAAGEDIKVVSEMMRHTSIKITGDVYTLVLPDLAASVGKSVAGAIPRKTGVGN